MLKFARKEGGEKVKRNVRKGKRGERNEEKGRKGKKKGEKGKGWKCVSRNEIA